MGGLTGTSAIAAAIYARKSTELWSVVVAAWRWIDWTAVSSVATLAAVIVALVPVFLGWKRERVGRRILCAQAMTHINAVRDVIAPESAREGTWTASPRVRAEADGLRNLLPAAHLLSKTEADALIHIVSVLTAFDSALDSYGRAEAKTLLHELLEASQRLRRRV